MIALALALQAAAPAMVVVDEKDTVRREAVPHGNIGMSTAYRISDAVPGRNFEFRRRVLDKGAAIGIHPIAHDEVYTSCRARARSRATVSGAASVPA